MPLYYFQLRNHDTLHDPEGTELPDVAAARAHAVAVARELMFNGRSAMQENWVGYTMTVFDAAGSELFSLALSDVGAG